LCYIRGGTPYGTTTRYTGCTDKSPPIKDKQVSIPYKLYFADQSPIWDDAGVAFINPHEVMEGPTGVTLGRMYLITREQFIDVVRQENGFELGDPGIQIDFKETIKNGKSRASDGWYSIILYLGMEDSYPIFTFTSANTTPEIELHPPGEKYLSTIIRGIQEIYELSDDEILIYIENLEGVRNFLNKQQILKIIQNG
jgi:effector-binding domain-containing protein